ncbi:MAG: ABC transporter ATP-binding protein [Azospirillaceae bacterium]|nr:ABC transporter ATP-binding protein [Azospirillaceae bacterium]
MTTMPLLQIDNLSVTMMPPGAAPVPILSDVSLTLDKGATLGIVGESGSGKSMLSLAIMGLLPPTARAAGTIALNGRQLLTLPESAWCRIRGRRIGMIFQEPMTALNPAMRIGDQIAEGIIWHRGVARAVARRAAIDLLDQVRIPDAKRRAASYPHEMSGGQRQRVGIAIALALQPDLMIADEPTTALDVTVQAEILDILDELVRERGMALIIISHDLGVIARAAHRTIVMYAGTGMEAGPTVALLRDPRHPYTTGLLAAMPRRRPGVGSGPGSRLATIPGTVPGFADMPAGCRFAGRCARQTGACREATPAWRLFGSDGGRGVRCLHAQLDAAEPDRPEPDRVMPL